MVELIAAQVNTLIGSPYLGRFAQKYYSYLLFLLQWRGKKFMCFLITAPYCYCRSNLTPFFLGSVALLAAWRDYALLDF
jgi:hypothetical protein